MLFFFLSLAVKSPPSICGRPPGLVFLPQQSATFSPHPALFSCRFNSSYQVCILPLTSHPNQVNPFSDRLLCTLPRPLPHRFLPCHLPHIRSPNYVPQQSRSRPLPSSSASIFTVPRTLTHALSVSLSPINCTSTPRTRNPRFRSPQQPIHSHYITSSTLRCTLLHIPHSNTPAHKPQSGVRTAPRTICFEV